MNHNMLIDDLGRVLLLSPTSSPRVFGLNLLLSNIQSVCDLSSFLKTSFGPCGCDKIFVDCDSSITITNDGATILSCLLSYLNSNSANFNPVVSLISQLSEAMDDEVGDGTTGVVVLTGSILEQCVVHLQRGVHPVKLCEGIEQACCEAVSHLERISVKIDRNSGIKSCLIENQYKNSDNLDKTEDLTSTTDKNTINPNDISDNTDLHTISLDEALFNAAKTSLNSKIVSSHINHFAKISVDAIKKITYPQKQDIDISNIKIESRKGSNISQTKIFNGCILSKEFSHPQMAKKIKNARIAILSTPFEPPKIKTKHNLNIKNKNDYEKLGLYEKSKFVEMIDVLCNLNVNLVICQWGFDDEANSLLNDRNISSVRWVGGSDIEQVALYTKGKIVARFEDLSESDLGRGSVEEISLGTDSERIILIQNVAEKIDYDLKLPKINEIKVNDVLKEKNVIKEGDYEKIEENDDIKSEDSTKNENDDDYPRMVTIYVRGGTETVIEEVKRSIRDSLCAVRNITKSEKITYGGGSSEMACSIHLNQKKQNKDSTSTISYDIFAKALEEIPLSLARNCGATKPIETVQEIKLRQIKENNSFIGIDIDNEKGECMVKKNVFDSVESKVKQYKMACQLATMILKIDDIIYNNIS